MGATEVVGGLLLAGWASGRLGLAWGPLPLLAAGGLALSGGVILVSVFLGLTCVSFWFEDRFGVQPPVYNCVVFGRYPIEVFHPAVRFLLRFVIPFAFIGYYPGGLFVEGGRWTPHTRMLAMATPLVAVACAAAAGLLWRVGVSRYRSTGS